MLAPDVQTPAACGSVQATVFPGKLLWACWAPERNKGSGVSSPAFLACPQCFGEVYLAPTHHPEAAGEVASGSQLRACPCQPRLSLCLSCQSLCARPCEAGSGAGAGGGEILIDTCPAPKEERNPVLGVGCVPQAAAMVGSFSKAGGGGGGGGLSPGGG